MFVSQNPPEKQNLMDRWIKGWTHTYTHEEIYFKKLLLTVKVVNPIFIE